MDYTEYKRLKDQIEEERQKKLAALEVVWQLSNGSSSASSGEVGQSGKASKSDSIRKVIEGLAGDFNADDVQQGIKDHGVRGVTRSQIINTLHRLCRRAELVVVKKGQGRLPGVYRKSIQEGAKV